jgi:hypothetical protein
MALKKHLTFHIIIANNRVLISYEGQPVTCYGCNAIDHVYQICPKRLEANRGYRSKQAITWAHVAKHEAHTADNGENKKEKANRPAIDIELEEEEHKDEEETNMGIEPEDTTQSEQTIPRIQEQETMNTNNNNKGNLGVIESLAPGMQIK